METLLSFFLLCRIFIARLMSRSWACSVADERGQVRRVGCQGDADEDSGHLSQAVLLMILLWR